MQQLASLKLPSDLHFNFSENLASLSRSSNSYRTGTVGKFIVKTSRPEQQLIVFALGIPMGGSQGGGGWGTGGPDPLEIHKL